MLSSEEYERALTRVEELMMQDPAADSDEGRALIALVDCVIEYEMQHYPMFALVDAPPKASPC